MLKVLNVAVNFVVGKGDLDEEIRVFGELLWNYDRLGSSVHS